MIVTASRLSIALTSYLQVHGGCEVPSPELWRRACREYGAQRSGIADTTILQSEDDTILQPAVDQWVNIKSVPGYAVINMGGALRQLSGQKLRSYLPRILACTSLEAGDPFFHNQF